ncbi:MULTISPECIES: TcmI family type II polyketide cyclase [Streptomyces]|uniref:TcmI family type II polyketide cyclase n=1 Tax=Streptomyces edwardsiae TaxID=3075527 RepID=A0ABU2QJF6_9ACTN|nr:MULTISPECIES: TcmI family type II polyketide cyclase [unclassified Streptomyces]MDT0396580.1 TcmI family type II polyketide cyclase [Streptomyces sp. DSM 41636]MDT0404606.1 TcmI family type II polyketide cyclase [Streptomyces sp. DSM 41635]
MHHALIVARMKPGSAPDIAEVFADSDRGELPHLVGVGRRSLFQFGDDVYLHLIESERDPAPAIAKLASHPEFRGVSERLEAYVSPYDPATWRGPKDAMARCFYRWESGPRS